MQVGISKVSSRSHYGMRMMTELAKAYGQGPVSLTAIAQAEELPLPYLEQLAITLRRGGLIEATRGAHGGYVLSKAPEKITALEVVNLVDGEIAPVECLTHDYVSGSCTQESSCSSRSIWQKVQQSAVSVLASTTLAEMIGTPQGAAS